MRLTASTAPAAAGEPSRANLAAMNTDELVNSAFREFPCLACSAWQSDRMKALLAWFYLTCERDGRPPKLTREQLMASRCKQGLRNVVGTVVTPACE
jgi:hypothetical protein